MAVTGDLTGATTMKLFVLNLRKNVPQSAQWINDIGYGLADKVIHFHSIRVNGSPSFNTQVVFKVSDELYETLTLMEKQGDLS